MSILYIFFKLYPLFGVALGVLMLDVTRSFRRRMSAFWYFFLLLSLAIFASVIVWIYYRGDLHSEEWFRYVLGK